MGPHAAGETALSVAAEDGFEVGQEILIAGGGLSESRRVVGFGSLLLDQGLENAYPGGATVTVQGAQDPTAAPTIAPASAPTPSPTGGTAAPSPAPDGPSSAQDVGAAPPPTPAPTPAPTPPPITIEEVAQLEDSLVEQLLSGGESEVTISSPGVKVAATKVQPAENKSQPVTVPVPDTAIDVTFPSSVFSEHQGDPDDSMVIVVSEVNAGSLMEVNSAPEASSVAQAEGGAQVQVEVKQVVSVSLYSSDGTPVSVRDLEEPIQISLPNLTADLECAWWDEDAKQWSTEGLTMVETERGLACATTHLTIFGAIAKGVVNTMECSQLWLFSVEGYKELMVYDWAHESGVWVVYLLLAMILILALSACIMDARARKSASLGTELFILMDVAGPLAPGRGSSSASVASGFFAITCCDLMAGKWKDALDDLFSSFFQFSAELRTVLEMLYDTFSEVFTAEDRLLTTTMMLVSRVAMQQATCALWMHPSDVAFLTEDKTNDEVVMLDPTSSSNVQAGGDRSEVGEEESYAPSLQQEELSLDEFPMDEQRVAPCPRLDEPARRNLDVPVDCELDIRQDEAHTTEPPVPPDARGRGGIDAPDLEPVVASRGPRHAWRDGAASTTCTSAQSDGWRSVQPFQAEPSPIQAEAEDGGGSRSLLSGLLMRIAPSRSLSERRRTCGERSEASGERFVRRGRTNSLRSEALGDRSEDAVAITRSTASRRTLAVLAQESEAHKEQLDLLCHMRARLADRQEALAKANSSWRSLPGMAWRSFAVTGPVGLVFAHSIVISHKLRALLLVSDLLGSVMLCTFFYVSSENPKTKKSRCAATTCDEHCAFEKVGRMIALAFCSVLIAGVPISLISSLHSRKFKWAATEEEKQRQLKAWRRRDVFIWVVALLYCFLAVNTIALFFSSVTTKVQLEWAYVNGVGMALDLVISPLIASCVLPAITLSMISVTSMRHRMRSQELIGNTTHVWQTWHDWRGFDEASNSLTGAADRLRAGRSFVADRLTATGSATLKRAAGWAISSPTEKSDGVVAQAQEWDDPEEADGDDGAGASPRQQRGDVFCQVVPS